jgi:hypothetical protein
MSRATVLPLAQLLLATLALTGCSSLVEGVPSPTPQDFGGIVTALGDVGISVSNPISGDAGCSDPSLVGPSIAFSASGLGMPASSPAKLRVYIFGDVDAFQRKRADVDRCIARWATDPATFETVDAAPYVLAGQGPWPAAFKTALQAALRAAAGAPSPNVPSGT